MRFPQKAAASLMALRDQSNNAVADSPFFQFRHIAV
jgi:hypothetical protein